MSKSAPGIRYGEVERETSETRVRVVVDLDGGTRRDISTGIGFFDHMLEQMAFHGRLDIGISAEGDLGVDDHHTVEDIGIVLGQAILEAVGKDEPVARYATSTTPMDDALILVSMDISGRGAYYHDVEFKRDRLGMLSTECVHEFFKSFANHAGITLHIRKLAGENDHHVCEAMFKGFGLALMQASQIIERKGSSSTKGTQG